MNEQTRQAFLAETHVAVLSVASDDARPPLTIPLWYHYDVMNDLMSFGVHRLWKRHFVATSGVRSGDHAAGGTAER